MVARLIELLRPRYWPSAGCDDFAMVAAKRSLSVFCLLAGSAGLAITGLNLRYLPDFAEQIALGLFLSLVCVAMPFFTNASPTFTRTAHTFCAFLFVGLASLCVMTGTLPSTATLSMIAMAMTLTLVFGLRIGLLYGVAAVGVFSWIYFTQLAGLPPVTLPTGQVIDLTNTYVVMSIVLIFTVLGSAVFRGEIVRATEGLKQSNAALEGERGSLERRVNERTTDMEAALEVAENANRAKSQFLATMSHELRTPLSAIIGYSELLLETAELDGREADSSDHRRVLRAARHLLALVNEVLDLSKVEAGKLQVTARPTDLRQLIGEVVEEVSVEARTRGNEIVVELDPELGTGEADAQKLRQCLLNLLSNAVKFTAGGRVSVRARRAADALVVEVEDTGIGIAEDDLQKLFEPFVQAEAADTRRFGGTGLGLAVTRRLARLMDGDVTVRSTLGEGSVFTLSARAPRLVQGSEALLVRA